MMDNQEALHLRSMTELAMMDYQEPLHLRSMTEFE